MPGIITHGNPGLIIFMFFSFLTIKYKVFNHPGAINIVEECCKEIIEGIEKKHPEILQSDRMFNGIEYTKELTINLSIMLWC